jgi:capsule polysaccharide export protein KpsE/RkpR
LKEKVVQKYDLQQVYRKETLQETLESLDDHMEVDVGDEGQIVISVWDRDQDRVDDIANYMAECLDSINIALTIADAHNNRIFIENRLNEILDSLNVLQDSLVSLMKTNNILSLEDQVRTSVEQSAILNGQLIQKEIEYDVTKASTYNKDPKLLMLEKEIVSIRQKLMTNFEQPGPTSFFIPKEQIPTLLMNIERIKRKINYFTQLIEYMGPLYEKSKVDEIRNIPTIQYLDHARRPDKKDKPKRSILVILIVGFVGIISAMGIVMFETKKR